MLEKPNISDETVLKCIEDEFGITNVPRQRRIEFLPLGADRSTAVYRLASGDKTYFLKLRLGDFDDASVAIPCFLSEQGVAQIIAPYRTRSGGLWAALGDFRVILYPFVEGRDGYDAGLADHHWVEFGAALKQIHALSLPQDLQQLVRMEDYSPHWRDALRRFMHQVETQPFSDPLSQQCAAFLAEHRRQVLGLIDRTERYAQALRTAHYEQVLCHSDLHAGNILIDTEDNLYLIDWDAPILAPKERDLMYPGGGLFSNRRSPAEEEQLFYQGYDQEYGAARVDTQMRAYYRYARIVEDLSVECELILESSAGPDDRERELRWMKANFLPGGVLDIARASDVKN